MPPLTPPGSGTVATGNPVMNGDDPHAPQKFRKLDLVRLAASPPEPIPWVIEDFAAKGETTMLYGVGGVLKSMLALALADGVARGETVGGFECVEGRVVYLDAENGEREIHRRIRGLGVDPEGISIYETAGVHLLDDSTEIEALIEAEQPSLVIFDSLRTLLPGAEENDSTEMAEALAEIRAFAQRKDVAIVVIHHAEKRGETYRGSSAIHDQVSMMFSLKREAGDPDRHRRSVMTRKCRIADEPEPRWISLVSEPPSFYVEEAEGFDPDGDSPVRSGMRSEILKLFAKASELSRPEIATQLDRTKADGTVRRVVSALVEEGRLTKAGGKYRCPNPFIDPRKRP